MKFLTSSKLSEHRYKTPEGYLVCVDAIIARTGKQEYHHNELFADSNDDSIIEVDRPYKEVFSPATIASFENKPLVDEHPDEDVNVENYKNYAVGFIRDVHEGEENGKPVLMANIIVTDQSTIEEIENGKTQLSCGYDCDILGDSEKYQANIRGNHVALCEQGRAGNARIVDSENIKDSWYYGRAYDVSQNKWVKICMNINTSDNQQGKDILEDNIDFPYSKYVFEGKVINKPINYKELKDSVKDDSNYYQLKEKLNACKTKEDYHKWLQEVKKDESLSIDELDKLINFYNSVKNIQDSIQDNKTYKGIEIEYVKSYNYYILRNSQGGVIGYIPGFKVKSYKEIYDIIDKKQYETSDSIQDAKRWEVGNRVRYEGRWYYIVAYNRGDWILEPEDGSRGEQIRVRADDSVKDASPLLIRYKEQGSNAWQEMEFKDLRDFKLYLFNLGIGTYDTWIMWIKQNGEKIWNYGPERFSNVEKELKFDSVKDGRTIKYKGFTIEELEGYQSPQYVVYDKHGWNMNSHLSTSSDLKQIKREIDLGYLDDYAAKDSINDDKSNITFVYPGATLYYPGYGIKPVKVLKVNGERLYVRTPGGNEYWDKASNFAGYNKYFMTPQEYDKKYGKDSIDDVEPRSTETKEEFISRFMSETKSEYPDEKQRFAVANSYWNRDSKNEEEVEDSVKDTMNLKQLENELDNLYCISSCYSNNNEIIAWSNWKTTQRQTEKDRIELMQWLDKNIGRNNYSLIYKSLDTRDNGKECAIKFSIKLKDSAKDANDERYSLEWKSFGKIHQAKYNDLDKAKQHLEKLKKLPNIEYYDLWDLKTNKIIDSVKDALENKPVTILVVFDDNKEANDALKTLQRKEEFMNSDFLFDNTIKVETTDIFVDKLKKDLKLFFVKKIIVKGGR